MKVALVAASGLAREAIEVLRLIDSVDDVVLLDDNPERWGGSVGGFRIVGGSDLCARYADHSFVVCSGRGVSRRSIVQRLVNHGVTREQFTSVIHPSVQLPHDCLVGRGVVMLAGAVVTANATLGDHVVVMPHAVITHDDVVEDYATLCAGVVLGGTVTVSEAAYLGMNSSVREGCRVGHESVLGMGSALIDDLPDRCTWAGVPARPILVGCPREH